MQLFNCSCSPLPPTYSTMRGPAVACIALGLLGAAINGEAAAAGKETIMWPDHGTIKLGVPKSPPYLILDLPGCLTLSMNWAENNTEIKKASGGNITILEGHENARKDGGELVVLITKDSTNVNVLVDAEIESGLLEARRAQIPIESCLISQLVVSSPTPEMLKDVYAAVSQEIKDVYMQVLAA